jgi:AcrR family transcriptional regulator
MWYEMTGTSAAAPADHDRKSPGRPRSARADEAIIMAVLELLSEGTAAETLSIEAVAGRAGVGKATIYRRWPNKEALLVDAVATLKGPPPTLAGTSVRDDLITLLRPSPHGGGQSLAGRIVPCLLSEMQRSEVLNRCYQRVLAPRRELMRQVLQRGIDSGELRGDLDVEMIMTLLAAPSLIRLIFPWNQQRYDPATLPERVVDVLWPSMVAP